jgi:hypothetical protein
MHHFLYNIKDIKLNYSLEYVDCFEHPMAIAYNWLKTGSDDLYLAYRKMYQSFFFASDHVDYIFKNYEDELGIRCNKVEIKDDFVEVITSLIDQDHPVVVPGNLKALYYSSYYLSENWPHLFLIKGYDYDKKLFYMLDATQQYQEDDIPLYVDFPIRFEDLEKVFKEYSVIIDSNIYYFELINSNVTYPERVLKYLDLLYDALSNHRYIEYKIPKVIDNIKEQKIQYNYILNIPKFRITAIESLIKCMEHYLYDTSKLTEIVTELGEMWKSNNLQFARKLLRNRYGHTEYLITDDTEKLERELLLEIHNCSNFLSDMLLSDNLVKDSYLFENNEDKIIEYINKQYVFDFCNNKVYNSWITDCSPKVIMYNEKRMLTSFDFNVMCTVITNCDKEGHQEGIFIRTESNKMFTFALDYMKSLVFDLVGQYTIFQKECSLKAQSLNLFTRLDNSSLIYGIISEDKIEEKMGEFYLGESVRQVGVFCKTWGECKKLKVTFYNNHITNNTDSYQ